MVLATQKGACPPSVLKRRVLPLTQPLPQPSARMVKYGAPVAALVGARSALMLPVETTPTVSPITSKLLLLVNRMAQRSFMAPWLVTSMGWLTRLYLAVVSSPWRSSFQTPLQLFWWKALYARARRSP